MLFAVGGLDIGVVQNLSGAGAELFNIFLAKLGALFKLFLCKLTLLCDGGQFVYSLKLRIFDFLLLYGSQFIQGQLECRDKIFQKIFKFGHICFIKLCAGLLLGGEKLIVAGLALFYTFNISRQLVGSFDDILYILIILAHIGGEGSAQLFGQGVEQLFICNLFTCL